MRDVRMRGFAERADVEEVERFLASHTHMLEAEPVEVLVGVRIMPNVAADPALDGEPPRDDPTRALPIPEDETAPVPKLVVPAG